MRIQYLLEWQDDGSDTHTNIKINWKGKEKTKTKAKIWKDCQKIKMKSKYT